jgi:hypothetical protein
VHTTHLCDAGDLALGRGPRGVRNRWAAGHLLNNYYNAIADGNPKAGS